MRISDWSSDVCSSDLADGADPARHVLEVGCGFGRRVLGIILEDHRTVRALQQRQDGTQHPALEVRVAGHAEGPPQLERHPERSEEHTSELQSLMRNSYAVFCLKKKNQPIGLITK